MSKKLKIKSKLNGNDLDLSLMNLKEVPVKDLATVPKGTRIDLSCNNLTCLPESFCDLNYITQLDLSKNQIKQLPDNFGNLKNLQRLDLFSNQLKILPESFYQLQRLKWLDVKDNPLDQQLKDVAGDFVTSEDYRSCAKKIVEFMTNVHNELEKEREKRRNKQQNKAASKKAKEDAKQEKQRLDKKAAKEKRKAEIEHQQQKTKDQKKNTQQQKPKNEPKSNKQAKDKAQNNKKKTAVKKTSSIGFWFWFLTINVLIISGLLWRYTGGDFSKESLQKAAVAISADGTRLLQSGSLIIKQYLLQPSSRVVDYVTDLWYKG